MEYRIETKILKRQLDQVVLYEQVENGIAISNNLSVDLVDQRFETPKRVFQIEQKHPRTEEKLASHKMPQATSIILHEVQIGEV